MIRFYDWSFVSGLEASFPTCNSNSKLGFWDRCFDSEKSVESGNLRFISGKEISIQKQNLEPGNEPSNLNFSNKLEPKLRFREENFDCGKEPLIQ